MDRIEVSRAQVGAIVLTLLVTAPWPSLVLADELPPPVANGGRMIVNAMEYPWSAIGRLNIAGKAFCSGFLIDESTVLTAAHCLEDLRAQRWRRPAELHFVAGYQRDRSIIDSPVDHYVLADDFKMSKNVEISNAGADWAVLRLTKPIGRQAGWLGLDRLDHQALIRLRQEGAVFVQAGYRADLPHALTADVDCDILGFIEGTSSVAHDCDVARGDSGSPILAFAGDKVRVVGLVSTRLKFKTPPAGVLARISGVALASASLIDQRRQPKAVAALSRNGGIWDGGSAPITSAPASPGPVQTIQVMLQRLGIREADPTGQNRTAMNEAIRTYQRRNGLSINGEGSIELLSHLIADSKS